jgi:hypothetical protein
MPNLDELKLVLLFSVIFGLGLPLGLLWTRLLTKILPERFAKPLREGLKAILKKS